MDKKEFQEFLMLYGADISAWPDGLDIKGQALLADGGEVASQLRALIEEESNLESLLTERTFEEPDDYLAGRIIAHAQEEAASADARGFLGALFFEFFTPRAFVALALTLVIGFMVGYMTPQNSLDSFDQFGSEDEMILEETFSSLFMEGDIFE